MLDPCRVRPLNPSLRPNGRGLLVRAKPPPHRMSQVTVGRPLAVQHLADELRSHPSGVADDLAGHVDGRRLALERSQPLVKVVEDLPAEARTDSAYVPPALPLRQR